MFFRKICVVNPYRVLCLKTSRILTRLFPLSERRQGLSSFGQDVFVMTFPTPLLTSHVLPQDFVGLTTNCAVNGIWYSILQQSPIGINASCVHPNGATSVDWAPNRKDTFGVVALSKKKFGHLWQAFVARCSISKQQGCLSTTILLTYVRHGSCFQDSSLWLWRRLSKLLWSCQWQSIEIAYPATELVLGIRILKMF